MKEFKSIFELENRNTKRRTCDLKAKKILQVSKVLNFESGVKDMFEMVDCFNIITIND